METSQSQAIHNPNNYNNDDNGSDSDSDGDFDIIGVEACDQEPFLSTLMVKSQMAMIASQTQGSKEDEAKMPATVPNPKDNETGVQKVTEIPGSTFKPGEAKANDGEETEVFTTTKEREDTGQDTWSRTMSTASSNYSEDGPEFTFDLKQLMEENMMLKHVVQAANTKYQEAIAKFNISMTQVKQQMTNYKEREADCQLTIKKLTEENTALNSKVESIKGLNDELKAAVRNIDAEKQTEIDALKSEIESMKVEMTRVKDQRDTALLKLQDQKQKEDSANEMIATLKSKIESVVAEMSMNAQRKADNANLDSKKQTEIDALKSKVVNMEVENIELTNQLKRAKVDFEANSRTEIELSELNDENSALRAQIENMDGQMTNMKNELEAVRQNCQSIAVQTEMEIKKLNMKISSLNDQLEGSKMKLADQKKTEYELAQLSTENSTLKTRLEYMASQFTILDSQKSTASQSLMQMQNEIKTLNSKITLLKDQLKEAEITNEFLRQSESDLLVLKKDHENLNSKCLLMAKELCEAKNRLVNCHPSLEAEKQKEIDTLTANNKSLTTELSRIKNEQQILLPKLKELKNTKDELLQLQDENSALKNQIENLDAQVIELQVQLGEAEARLKPGVETSEVDALNSKIKLLTDQLKKARRTIREQKQSEAELLKFSKDQLKYKDDQLEEEKKVFAELQGLYDGSQDRLNEYKKKLWDAEQKLIADSEELQRLRRTESEMSGKLGSCATKLSQTEGEMTVKDKEIAKLRSQIKFAQAELKIKQDTLDEKELRHASYSKKLIAGHQAEMSKLDKLLAEKNLTLQRLKDDFEAKESLNKAVLDALSKLEKDISKCQQELIKKEAELTEAKLARKKCQEIVAGYKTKNIQLTASLSETKALLEQVLNGD